MRPPLPIAPPELPSGRQSLNTNPPVVFRPLLPDRQPEKHAHIPARQILDRIVLGGSDGVIEGVAMTAALNGAHIPHETIFIAGLAFAVAGGLSMFFSNYLSRRSELDSLKVDIERERTEIETEPEEERAELEDLLKKEGYGQKEVDVIMSRLTRDKEMWLRAQLNYELKLNIEDLETDPVTRSASAGIAFFLMGMVALLPYALGIGGLTAFAGSVVLSIIALFALGSKAFTLKTFSPMVGAESAAVGVSAAVLLFGVGRLISSL